MRFIVMGAGAVGGAIGGRLHEHDHDVVLVARGEHARAMRERGLTLRSPAGTSHLRPPVATDPTDLDPRDDDVVLLCVKTQDSAAALGQLSARFPVDTPVLCVQNGIANEAMALRSFRNVYGVPVMLPAVFLEPGVVDVYSSPVSGILDVGRYPSGTDDVADAVAAALRSSTFESEVRADVMAWKWTKLLANLGNAAIALCGPDVRKTDLPGRLRAEALACFGAAGIGWIADDEWQARNRELRPGQVEGRRSPGGSTFQSVVRGRDVETEFLNGEIVLLGRLHGVPTPVNEGLQRLLRVELARGFTPGSMTADELVRRLDLDSPRTPA